MHRRHLLALLSSAAVLPRAALSAQPRGLPPYGPLSLARTSPVTEARLDNGLTVWLVPRDGPPKTTMFLAMRGGSGTDPAESTGLSEVLAASLLQGTAKRDASQLAGAMQAAGGRLSSRVTADAICLEIGCLTSESETALDLLADVVTNPALNERAITQARDQLAANLKGQEATAYVVGWRALCRALFAKHPYAAATWSAAAVAGIGAAQVQAARAARLTPSPALLVVAGSFEPARMMALVHQHLDAWRGSSQAVEIPAAEPIDPQSPAILCIPREGSVQTTLLVGALGPRRDSAEYAAFQLGHTIYGGTTSSRLLANVREARGYAYSAGSSITSYRMASLFRASADVRNAVAGATLNEMIYELNRLATTPPDDDEIERARRYVIGTQALRLQSRGAEASMLADLWLDGRAPAALTVFGQHVQAATRDDIARCGQAHLAARRMTIVAVGAEDVLRRELEPIGRCVRV